jgi:ATP-dependent helicase/nuclease subunit B
VKTGGEACHNSGMSDSPARVYTIPPSAPFLPTLAEALVEGRLIPGFRPKDDPLILANATVFLPTRRAVRIFSTSLLEAIGQEALILPRILPLGGVDEDEFAFEENGADLPPAIPATGRRLVLAQLILQWARVTGAEERLIASTPAASLAFADELAHVLDDLTIAGVPHEKLTEAVPHDFDRYWETARAFLNIIWREWPNILREQNQIDPTDRRERLLARETARLAAASGGPVIAAGSTGSLPSVARLLNVIARRKDGAVVLPGLDQLLDEKSFAEIGSHHEMDAAQGHPQYGLHRLLGEFGIKRSDVVSLAVPPLPAREKLLSEAFRPAGVTDRWQANAAGDDALDDVTLVEAADPREEALAIAVALRESLARKIPYSALITPDRALARRVAAELTRWNIKVDDSAGIPLAESEAGRFARLAAEAAASQLAPVPLIALLRHPLCAFAAHEIDALEQGILRGPRPASGTRGLLRAIETARTERYHPNDPKARLKPEDWDSARALAEKLQAALDPLCRLGERPLPFGQLLNAHRTVLSALGFDENAGHGAEELAEILDELAAAPAPHFALTLADYAEAFTTLLAGTPLRAPLDEDAAIRILGPIEARLVGFDRVVLGGLNEGTWPAGAKTDAFLNRPMRRALGLNVPERRIGLSAHDFVQMLGTRDVLVTRARRQGGAETVASRSWQRLAAVATEKSWKAALMRGERLLELARMLDRPEGTPKPIEKPAPRPPLAARPKRLSVTEIEDLVRDPYTIYARHVLKVFPLEEIDADPGVAERGIVLHDALARFTEKFPQALPRDALDQLIAAGREAFVAFDEFPGAKAVWWPRFERIARWFVAAEQARRPHIDRIRAEIRGEISFTVNDFPFTLAAKADRFEIRNDKAIGVLDYKTGAPPSLSQAITGLAPQLPLEAAIVRAGGFKGIPKGARIAEIGVFHLSGGNPPGRFVSLNPAEAKRTGKKLPEQYGIENCDQLADFAFERLKGLIAHYTDAASSYPPIPRPKWKQRYGSYDHLARIKEWSSEDEGEE